MSKIVKSSNETKIDFERISLEIVRALRNQKNQKEMNQLIGYKFNQYAKWESGEKKFLLNDLINVSKIINIDLNEAFSKVFQSHTPDVFDQKKYIEELRGDLTISQFCQTVGLNRVKIDRWFRHETEIILSDFLALIHYRSNNLDLFINALTDIKKLPYCYTTFKCFIEFRQLVEIKPWTPVVLQLLGHKNCPSLQAAHQFVFEKTGIDIEESKFIIKKLIDMSLLTINADGKHSSHFSKIVIPKENGMSSDLFWFNKLHNVIQKMSASDYDNENVKLGFAIFNVNDNSYLKIKKQIKIFTENIQKIVSENNSKSEASSTQVIYISLLDIEQFKKMKVDLS